MQLVKNHEKIANYIFAIAIYIHTAIMCVGYSVWDIPYKGRLLQLACVLCCIKIIMTRYEMTEWFWMFVVAIFCGASYACSREKYLVYVATLVFAAKSTDMKKYLRIILYAVLTSTVVIAILSLVNIGGIAVDTRDYGRGMVETRWCLGFGHANNLHGTIWYMVTLLLIVLKDKFNWKHYVAFTTCNLILYFFTLSRAGVIATQLMIIGGILYTYCNRQIAEKKWIYIGGLVALAGVITITLISVYVDCWTGYGPILKALDRLTTGRINLAYQSAYIGDWHMFTAGGTHKYTVDNGFAWLPATYGYVVGVAYVALIVLLLFGVYKKKDGILLFSLMTCVFYTFMESSYTMNDAYLLGNYTYIIAMIMIGTGYEYGKCKA